MKNMYLAVGVGAAMVASVGCSGRESSNGAVARDSSAATSAPPATGAAAGSSSSTDSIVRGTVTTISDSVLVLKAPSGDIRVALTQPLTVYEGREADLSRVTDNSFVGVTSVPQPDGSQRATEIHVFANELRGLGEGSRPMGRASGGSRSTMTNGSVASSRMTNGAARMTNGSARGAAGGTITVAYNGGSQTITVPPGVQVTEIARTDTKLVPGTSVIIPATRKSDGTLETSRVMLAGQATPKK